MKPYRFTTVPTSLWWLRGNWVAMWWFGVGDYDDTWRARLGAGHEALPACEYAAAGGYSEPVKVFMAEAPIDWAEVARLDVGDDE